MWWYSDKNYLIGGRRSGAFLSLSSRRESLACSIESWSRSSWDWAFDASPVKNIKRNMVNSKRKDLSLCYSFKLFVIVIPWGSNNHSAHLRNNALLTANSLHGETMIRGIRISCKPNGFQMFISLPPEKASSGCTTSTFFFLEVTFLLFEPPPQPT